MSTNVQSVVTPATTPLTNGVIHTVGSIKASKAAAKAKAATAPATAPATAAPIMTADEAVKIAFDYGTSVAGMDGSLTTALKVFAKDAPVQERMRRALNVGYMMRKLGYDEPTATDRVGRLTYSDKPGKQDDHHRSFAEERVMVAVRVLWNRAGELAGIEKPKAKGYETAEANRAKKEAEKKETEQRLIKADELVNPKDDTDPFDAMARLVLTMKALQNKYAAKLVGDRGTAWRDWLANAPK